MPRRDHQPRKPSALPGSTAALALLLVVALAPGAATGSDAVLCLGAPATQVGTAGDDELHGTPGADVIAGLGGSDIIDGLGGDDRLCGGAGLDDIAAGAGADQLEGGANDDTLDGGPGVDTVSYAGSPVAISGGLSFGRGLGWGNDTLQGVENLVGSRFADQLGGSNGPNMLWGGPGNDKLSALGGADTLYGEAGNDFLDGGNGVDTINGGTGANWCFLGERVRACRHTGR